MEGQQEGIFGGRINHASEGGREVEATAAAAATEGDRQKGRETRGGSRYRGICGGRKEKEEDEGAFLPSLPSDAWQNAGHKFTELELRTVGHFLISGSREPRHWHATSIQPRKKTSQTFETERESKDGGESLND